MMSDVNVHMKKNFVYGIVLIKKFDISIKKNTTVVKENIVHQRLIEAMSSITGSINTGKIASKAICLAPPFQGTLSRS